ncbi:hypothetical protein PAXINDRAFT_71204, partial [Paxillus involutus ATCC 200175]
LNIFPRNGLSILPFAQSVVVSAPNMGASFDGVVLELPNKPKTLYVDGKNAPAVSLRESIVALLDLADEQLQCSGGYAGGSSSWVVEPPHNTLANARRIFIKPAMVVTPDCETTV